MGHQMKEKYMCIHTCGKMLTVHLGTKYMIVVFLQLYSILQKVFVFNEFFETRVPDSPWMKTV